MAKFTLNSEPTPRKSDLSPQTWQCITYFIEHYTKNSNSGSGQDM